VLTEAAIKGKEDHLIGLKGECYNWQTYTCWYRHEKIYKDIDIVYEDEEEIEDMEKNILT